MSFLTSNNQRSPRRRSAPRRSARRRLLIPVVAIAATLGLIATACGSDDDDSDASAEDAIATYARGVRASYEASLATARVMDSAIDAFLADPSDETLNSAKQTWLSAREDYGPTEAFRFYDGPIEEVEGLVNAWPLDEAYIDYVEGAPDAGIINDPATFPTIDADLLTSLNEQGGEENVSTGWHAIEFLLWGQDLSASGPGNRPVSDYTSRSNADRRAQYLRVASDLLLTHLQQVSDEWAPDASNYRADFLQRSNSEALNNIITGIGELSRGELAGERMNVAYSERSQEDEHSCFSDNTTRDIVGNARGIQMVLTANYPGGVTGTSILDLVDEEDSALATRLNSEVASSVTTVSQIPGPFDQHLRDGVPDSDPGRMAVLAGIVSLEDQTDTIVAAATALGVTINVT